MHKGEASPNIKNIVISSKEPFPKEIESSEFKSDNRIKNSKASKRKREDIAGEHLSSTSSSFIHPKIAN